MNFCGQHAIITGGSSGIGKAIAQQLTQAGANLSLIARDPAKLATTQTELVQLKSQSDQTILTLAADVANQSQATQAIQHAIAQLGAPHLLITAAGMVHPGYFQELPLAVFTDTMAVNYFGTVYCVKAVLPSMVARRSGQIVLIASGAGLIGLFGYSAYSPSKFAVRGLAEALRGELKPNGINIAVVYPPDTDTPQLAAENQLKPAETRQITALAECLTAEQVAQAILQGLQKQQFIITPGSEMSLLARLHSLVSPLLQWQFDRIVAKSKCQ